MAFGSHLLSSPTESQLRLAPNRPCMFLVLMSDQIQLGLHIQEICLESVQCPTATISPAPLWYIVASNSGLLVCMCVCVCLGWGREGGGCEIQPDAWL